MPAFDLITVRHDIYMVPDVLSDCVCWNIRANETGTSEVRTL